MKQLFHIRKAFYFRFMHGVCDVTISSVLFTGQSHTWGLVFSCSSHRSFREKMSILKQALQLSLEDFQPDGRLHNLDSRRQYRPMREIRLF